MRIGYQGEPLSYSHVAAEQLFEGTELTGYPHFALAFDAITSGAVDRLVLPIENSTTGSVLPVLDRLVDSAAKIIAEHRMEIRHALLGLPGADIESITQVHSHPEALAQVAGVMLERGWRDVPEHDTAGAVRLVAERQNVHEAALAPAAAADAHGLVVLASDVADRTHNTTRFVVLATNPPALPADADKTTVAFETLHRPGALALALTELGLRGANLTRIESRPFEEAFKYRFFVDLMHQPGPKGYRSVFDPMPATLGAVHHLGTYRSFNS